MYVARRRGINRGCILVLLSALLICAVPGYFIYRAIADSVIGDVVTLQAHPLVAIESCSTVKVTGNNTSGTVTIRGDRYDREIDGNALYIKGRACLEIDVEVPANADLRVIATTDVEITGITGELQLKGGQIMLLRSTLQGKSSLESDESIFFNGALAPQGALTVTTYSAPVDIELPSDSTFTCDITGSLQSFNTTFTEIQYTVKNSENIDDIHARVGVSPQARLAIFANDASVLLTGI